MARTQAADYDQRREAITATAAGLYARHGFLGASVSQIAAACKTSKSLIYHYYPSKEDILFDVMDLHVQSLVQAAREIDEGAGSPREKIALLARALMDRYAGAEDQHKVLLNELINLPPERRAIIVEHQRNLLDIFDRLLSEAQPGLGDDHPRRRALTMLFFGMVNWTHTWFDPSGPLQGATIADMASTMFLHGVEDAAKVG
ncbi:TetR/AcrR family transcriptional regulator [Sphingomonas naphthae]|uniref:TetR/AcrR family transcriptional regulator n=1 Tax=Sphingomonas naphthae TaxID=1813468 RepID=A0ABY7TJG8_9SPHN|nr:TetR/AcrR family transcriptional regulator [Sphingomonas naphthae]WCT72464.1 TetR/AcrR family transcriptional regulator [Sphingomonas naphthae]